MRADSLQELSGSLNLTPQDVAVIQAYHADSTTVNSALRDEERTPDFDLATMDAIISRASLNVAQTLYRVVADRWVLKDRDGSSYCDRGYLSTSAERSQIALSQFFDSRVHRHAILEIEVPAGKALLPIWGVPGIDETENEVLLPRGAQLEIIQERVEKDEVAIAEVVRQLPDFQVDELVVYQMTWPGIDRDS